LLSLFRTVMLMLVYRSIEYTDVRETFKE